MKKILLLAGFGICFLQAKTGPKEEKRKKWIKIEFTIKNDTPSQITIEARSGGKKELLPGATLSLSYVKSVTLAFKSANLPFDHGGKISHLFVHPLRGMLHRYEIKGNMYTFNKNFAVRQDESILVTIRFYQDKDIVSYEIQTKVQGPLKSLFKLALEPTIKQIKQNTLSLQQLKEKVPDEVYKSVIAEISRQMGVENWVIKRFYLLELPDGRKELIEKNKVTGKPSSKKIFRLSYPNFKGGVIFYFTDIEKLYQKKEQFDKENATTRQVLPNSIDRRSIRKFEYNPEEFKFIQFR